MKMGNKKLESKYQDILNDEENFVVIKNLVRNQYVWYSHYWNDNNTTEFGHCNDISQAKVYRKTQVFRTTTKYCKIITTMIKYHCDLYEEIININDKEISRNTI